MLQGNNRNIKGDWLSTCFRDIEQLDINMSLEDIKSIKLTKFKEIVKEKIHIKAFDYLRSRIKSKGKEIIYEYLKTCEYLLPNDHLSIEDQKLIFSIRSKMVKISDSYSKIEENCICSIKVDLRHMRHIYDCQILNENKISVEYNKIYNGNIREQKVIVDRMKQNLIKRQEIKQKYELNKTTELN